MYWHFLLVAVESQRVYAPALRPHLLYSVPHDYNGGIPRHNNRTRFFERMGGVVHLIRLSFYDKLLQRSGGAAALEWSWVSECV